MSQRQPNCQTLIKDYAWLGLYSQLKSQLYQRCELAKVTASHWTPLKTTEKGLYYFGKKSNKPRQVIKIILFT